MDYFTYLYMGIFLGVITHLIAIDPNFLGHPSGVDTTVDGSEIPVDKSVYPSIYRVSYIPGG